MLVTCCLTVRYRFCGVPACMFVKICECHILNHTPHVCVTALGDAVTVLKYLQCKVIGHKRLHWCKLTKLLPALFDRNMSTMFMCWCMQILLKMGRAPSTRGPTKPHEAPKESADAEGQQRKKKIGKQAGAATTSATDQKKAGKKAGATAEPKRRRGRPRKTASPDPAASKPKTRAGKRRRAHSPAPSDPEEMYDSDLQVHGVSHVQCHTHVQPNLSITCAQ